MGLIGWVLAVALGGEGGGWGGLVQADWFGAGGGAVPFVLLGSGVGSGGCR